MILKSALQKYVARERADYRPMKDWSDDKLTKYVEQVNKVVKLPIWDKLRHHQRVGFAIGIVRKKFAYFMDMGCGKTLMAIALTRYFAEAGLNSRVLVLVPRLANKSEWAREIEKHSPTTRHLVLNGSSQHKWDQLHETNALIVIDTYSGFVRMLCTLVPTRRKQKNQLKPDVTRVNAVMQLIDGLILDECHHVSNQHSLAFRICRQLRKAANTLFGLTGTPFGRDPQLLWAQLFLVDDGYALGESIGLFREEFFSSHLNYWGGMEYTFRKKKEDQLNRFLAHSSIRYEADAADLPRVIPIQKVVSLPTDARSYYNQARQMIIKAHGNYREMQNAFLRMRQISSGYVGYHDDENGTKAEFEFPTNPKLDMLMSILEGIAPKYKVVVFHEFHWSGERIARELQQEGIRYLHLYGKTGKDVDDILHRFDHDSTVNILLLSNQLAIGLNLQVARYAIFFESPVSVIIRKQAQRRVERQESEHDRIFVYDLVTAGTVDHDILRFHKQGADLLKAILDGKHVPSQLIESR
jgi:SNF2 family DNA or RNA helicase